MDYARLHKSIIRGRSAGIRSDLRNIINLKINA
nr:MAG TPA: hypothetical protein [Caudoviricetes sp.]